MLRAMLQNVIHAVIKGSVLFEEIRVNSWQETIRVYPVHPWQNTIPRAKSEIGLIVSLIPLKLTCR